MVCPGGRWCCRNLSRNLMDSPSVVRVIALTRPFIKGLQRRSASSLQHLPSLNVYSKTKMEMHMCALEPVCSVNNIALQLAEQDASMRPNVSLLCSETTLRWDYEWDENKKSRMWRLICERRRIQWRTTYRLRTCVKSLKVVRNARWTGGV
jgi:hypothetical protein